MVKIIPVFTSTNYRAMLHVDEDYVHEDQCWSIAVCAKVAEKALKHYKDWMDNPDLPTCYDKLLSRSGVGITKKDPTWAFIMPETNTVCYNRSGDLIAWDARRVHGSMLNNWEKEQSRTRLGMVMVLKKKLVKDLLEGSEEYLQGLDLG
ncbi:hypothetical protein HDU76_007778, partial [Blyttiomyces sp. JEL0837]